MGCALRCLLIVQVQASACRTTTTITGIRIRMSASTYVFLKAMQTLPSGQKINFL
jgi:hypothetical protein